MLLRQSKYLSWAVADWYTVSVVHLYIVVQYKDNVEQHVCLFQLSVYIMSFWCFSCPRVSLLAWKPWYICCHADSEHTTSPLFLEGIETGLLIGCRQVSRTQKLMKGCICVMYTAMRYARTCCARRRRHIWINEKWEPFVPHTLQGFHRSALDRSLSSLIINS